MQPANAASDDVECGIVVIGRNEGDRLRLCLASCRSALACVYVDSNSSDDSLAIARAAGATIVELEPREKFSAGLARNAGFASLLEERPELRFVAFVDGDCELFPTWIRSATDYLRAHPDVVAVCGRRRERYPDASVFNMLCDLEWNSAAGETKSFGGDVVIRADAFAQAGGYRSSLIAGEEPELCVRLRAVGGRIWRLDQDMTWHDAAMTRFRQWWRRNVRSGHAFAEGSFLHGRPPENHFVAETRRALAWGLMFPATGLLLAVLSPYFLALFLIYPFQIVRLASRMYRQGTPHRWIYAAFLVLGRFPEVQGVLKFHWGKFVGRRSVIIEYK